MYLLSGNPFNIQETAFKEIQFIRITIVPGRLNLDIYVINSNTLSLMLGYKMLV